MEVQTDNTVAVMEQWISELQGSESLSDTPFSELYHEARTSSTDPWSGVVVQYRVRDGVLETSDPVKTRQGEHLRGTDRWDGMISLRIVPFMSVEAAYRTIICQLRSRAQVLSARTEVPA